MGYLCTSESTDVFFKEYLVSGGGGASGSRFNVFHIYGSMFHCLKMVKMYDVNNSDLKDTIIASLKRTLN